jgi:hypothetical protein
VGGIMSHNSTANTKNNNIIDGIEVTGDILEIAYAKPSIGFLKPFEGFFVIRKA